jgi:polar amino acid transport system substrate-binding protein
MLRLLITLTLTAVVAGVSWRWLLRHGITPPLSDLFPAGEIVIGVDASYPPFAVAIGDDLFGLDIDIGREIGRRIGLPVRFVNMGYDGLYDSLRAGQTDMTISTLLMDGFRLGDVRYTRFYFDSGLILVYDKTNPIDSGIEGIPGHAIAYEFGSSADSEVRLWSRRLSPFDTRPYELPTHTLDAVRFGEADAALVDAITGRLYLRDHADWGADYTYVTHAPFAAAVRIDRVFVWKLANRALQAMVEDGTLDAIIARWL